MSPANFLNLSHALMNTVVFCTVLEQGDLFLSLIFVTECMTGLLEYLKATTVLIVSLCGKNSTSKHPSASQKIVPLVLEA
jgi:hypothetical protein